MAKFENIIAPVKKDLLLKELTEDRLLRIANKGNNEIYCFVAEECPNLMQEVGRIRELAFRSAGGGTGKAIDVDAYDVSKTPYHQLIVWSPERKEILGGYRYLVCSEVGTDEDGEMLLATNHMFDFSEKFKKEYLPYTIELGRSFIHPHYQSTNRNLAPRSIFVLDNLWDGLGALVKVYPNIRYFFGKITMYPTYKTEAKGLLACFFRKYFYDKENLVTPLGSMKVDYCKEEDCDRVFYEEDYKQNYKILSKKIRELGENIPPLFNAYMNLSPSMRHFGTAVNEKFGGVEETAILLTVSDIYEAKKRRHLASYIPNLKFKLRKKLF